MAAVDAAAPPKKGPSPIVQGAVVLILTLAALGGGWFAGNMLGARVQPGGGADSASASHAASGGHGDAKGDGAEAEAPVNPLLVPLAPMTTNLAAPDTVWVQMELALLLDQPQPPDMI